MTTLVAYIVALALVAGAVGAVIAAVRAIECYRNLLEARPHRERLAELVFKIESDPEAPAPVRRFVGLMADNAFNAEFLSGLLVPRNPRERRIEMSEIAKSFRRDFGDHFAHLLLEVAHEFTLINGFNQRVLLRCQRQVAYTQRYRFYPSPEQ